MTRALDPAEAAFFASLQGILYRRKVAFPRTLSRICAVDAAYSGDRIVAVASLFRDGRHEETSSYVGSCSLPYVSGLFFLREGPFVAEAVKGLESRPQLVCFDAHGAAHPRSAGMATVCGMALGIPSLGVAKSLLVGTVASVGPGFGRIIHDGRAVGFCTGTGRATRYWSPGFSISLGRLESVIRGYAPVCLRAMSDSDRASREEVGVEATSQP
ncbi:MAG TPA: endonuclease V [Nitrososphaerales archaeon]|nr:endonuclease V [Nitrososphaerales archaeon]